MKRKKEFVNKQISKLEMLVEAQEYDLRRSLVSAYTEIDLNPSMILENFPQIPGGKRNKPISLMKLKYTLNDIIIKNELPESHREGRFYQKITNQTFHKITTGKEELFKFMLHGISINNEKLSSKHKHFLKFWKEESLGNSSYKKIEKISKEYDKMIKKRGKKRREIQNDLAIKHGLKSYESVRKIALIYKDKERREIAEEYFKEKKLVDESSSLINKINIKYPILVKNDILKIAQVLDDMKNNNYISEHKKLLHEREQVIEELKEYLQKTVGTSIEKVKDTEVTRILFNKNDLKIRTMGNRAYYLYNGNIDDALTVALGQMKLEFAGIKLENAQILNFMRTVIPLTDKLYDLYISVDEPKELTETEFNKKTIDSVSKNRGVKGLNLSYKDVFNMMIERYRINILVKGKEIIRFEEIEARQLHHNFNHFCEVLYGHIVKFINNPKVLTAPGMRMYSQGIFNDYIPRFFPDAKTFDSRYEIYYDVLGQILIENSERLKKDTGKALTLDEVMKLDYTIKTDNQLGTEDKKINRLLELCLDNSDDIHFLSPSRMLCSSGADRDKQKKDSEEEIVKLKKEKRKLYTYFNNKSSDGYRIALERMCVLGEEALKKKFGYYVKVKDIFINVKGSDSIIKKHNRTTKKKYEIVKLKLGKDKIPALMQKRIDYLVTLLCDINVSLDSFSPNKIHFPLEGIKYDSNELKFLYQDSMNRIEGGYINLLKFIIERYKPIISKCRGNGIKIRDISPYLATRHGE